METNLWKKSAKEVLWTRIIFNNCDRCLVKFCCYVDLDRTNILIFYVVNPIIMDLNI